MIEKIKQKLEKYKNIAILGFGREGKSTYKFFRSILENKHLTIIDKINVLEKNDFLKEDKNLSIVYGDTYLDNLDDYDFIMKTPGISLVDIYEGDNISSQLNLVLEFYKNQVIGVTGTKGKSTASSLIYEAVKASYSDVFLAGNIGKPVLDDIYSFTDKSIIVFEISAQQLSDLKYSPHYAFFLNLMVDHLDYFHSVENYEKYKLNMLKNQTQGDYAFVNPYDEHLISRIKDLNLKSKVIDFKEEDFLKDNDIYIGNKLVYSWNKETRIIKGDHYSLIFLMVLKLIDILKLDREKAIEAMNNFKGLAHRLEFAGSINGVEFYDDTIATMPDAVINGIKSLGNVSVLFLGGSSKNLNYDKMITFINQSNIKFVVLQGPVGKELDGKIKKDYIYEDDFKKAIKKALDYASSGTSILLSPGAASFDKYKDYAEKGETFKEAIKEIKCLLMK